MCTEAYVVEHPCDIPWMPDEHGDCTVLIENHINAQGPSRRIFMAYHAWASLICFFASCYRLRHVLGDPILRREHQGFRLLGHPRVMRVVLLVCGTMAIAVQAVDVRGYGGRLSFATWWFFAGLGVYFMFLTTLWTGFVWYEDLSEPEEAAGRKRQADFFKIAAVIANGLWFTVGRFLEVYLRPPDAALGVTNANLGLLGHCVFSFFLMALVPPMVGELLRVRRRVRERQKQLAKGGTPREKPRRRRSGSAPVLPMVSRGALDEEVSPTSPHNGLEMKKARNAMVADTLLSHQLLKYVLLYVGVGVFSVPYTGLVVLNAMKCWAWEVPPDSQYFEPLVVIELLSAMAVSTVPLKTHELHYCCAPQALDATESELPRQERTPRRARRMDRWASVHSVSAIPPWVADGNTSQDAAPPTPKSRHEDFLASSKPAWSEMKVALQEEPRREQR